MFESHAAVATICVEDSEFVVASAHPIAQPADAAMYVGYDADTIKRGGVAEPWKNDVVFAGLEPYVPGKRFIVGVDLNTSRLFQGGPAYFDRAADAGWVDVVWSARGEQVPTFLTSRSNAHQLDYIFVDRRSAAGLKNVDVLTRVRIGMGTEAVTTPWSSPRCTESMGTHRRVLGIDLSTNPRNTAGVVLDVKGATVRTELHTPLKPDVLVELVRTEHARGSTVAVDVPFGWPTCFVDALEGYHRSRPEPWPSSSYGRPESILRRRTDVVVRERLAGVGVRKSPISVAVDKLASTAAYWAALAGDATAGRSGYSRDGSDGVIEVYPAASLAMWGVWRRGRTALDVADRIFEQLPLAKTDGVRRGALEHLSVGDRAGDGHIFDALAGALTALAYVRGGTIPIEQVDVSLAQVEGWIHLPKPGAVSDLFR